MRAFVVEVTGVSAAIIDKVLAAEQRFWLEKHPALAQQAKRIVERAR
jgi:hypothetical protein